MTADAPSRRPGDCPQHGWVWNRDYTERLMACWQGRCAWCGGAIHTPSGGRRPQTCSDRCRQRLSRQRRRAAAAPSTLHEALGTEPATQLQRASVTQSTPSRSRHRDEAPPVGHEHGVDLDRAKGDGSWWAYCECGWVEWDLATSAAALGAVLIHVEAERLSAVS